MHVQTKKISKFTDSANRNQVCINKGLTSTPVTKVTWLKKMFYPLQANQRFFFICPHFSLSTGCNVAKLLHLILAKRPSEIPHFFSALQCVEWKFSQVNKAITVTFHKKWGVNHIQNLTPNDKERLFAKNSLINAMTFPKLWLNSAC